MEDNNLKVMYTKPIEKQNMSANMNIATESEVKTILDVACFSTDEKIDCGKGNATISGKFTVRVVFVDSDNLTTTVTDQVNYSQTISDSAITSDSFLMLGDIACSPTATATDGSIKVDIDANVSPTLFMNIPVSSNIDIDDAIVKKTDVQTMTIQNFVKTKFEYSVNLETRDKISKVLARDVHFFATKLQPDSDSVTVEGKMLVTVLYETETENERQIKTLSDCFNVKSDFELSNTTQESNLNLFLTLDHAKEQVSTDLTDDNSVLTITNTIVVSGVSLTPVNLETVLDAYSTDNELTLNRSSRNFTTNYSSNCFFETISNEMAVNSDEPAIDDIVANLNAKAEITNKYLKDGMLVVEGVVSSCVVYVNEFHEYSKKQTEIPFVVNSKLKFEENEQICVSVEIEDCKVKAKRGTVIELEYALCFCTRAFKTSTCEMVDGVSVGKPLDFSMYDYQIFIAKPNETNWDICKRIKVSPEDLKETNPDLPELMQGGEKIIIKR